jgi:formiminotetrahydrofolate cyclodeaminase
MALTDLTVQELIAAFRSPDPTPGGGSAAALAGAVGTALLAMVASLSRPRASTPEEVERLAEAGRRCTELSNELALLIDGDSEAYQEVLAAHRLPKGTAEQSARRAERIQEALHGATVSPLAVMRCCSAATSQAATVAALGNRNASSDLRSGLELLGAALRAAMLNVEINLDGLKDAASGTAIRTEASRLVATAGADADAVRQLLQLL